MSGPIPAETVAEVVRLGAQLGHAERILRRIANGQSMFPRKDAAEALVIIGDLRGGAATEAKNPLTSCAAPKSPLPAGAAD